MKYTEMLVLHSGDTIRLKDIVAHPSKIDTLTHLVNCNLDLYLKNLDLKKDVLETASHIEYVPNTCKIVNFK